MLAQTTHDEEK